MARFTTYKKLLDAVTVDTTGDAEDVSERHNMSVQFVAGDITSGNGIFSIEVSNDGVNFVTYNRLTTNATNTDTKTDIGVASVTLNSNTSAIYFIRNGDHFRFIRAKVDVTTDGAYSAHLVAID